jgi:lambda family phage portal protein
MEKPKNGQTAHRAPGGLQVVERAIAAIAPQWAAARARARVDLARNEAAATVLRHYDANAYSRRTKGWIPGQGSGVAATRDLEWLRARAHDLARNNEWMVKGLGVIQDATVGHGFTVKWVHEDKQFEKDLQARWNAWADSLEIDPEGLECIDAKLGSAVHAMAEGGDVLFRRRWRRASDGLSVPLQVQLLEGEHLDSDKNQRDGAARIVQGIEYDRIGRRVAYWIRKEHPGDPDATLRESTRVDAADVLHLFRVERPGAVRGVPWGAPCILRLRDFQEYEDAQLLRVKLANMFVGAVEFAVDVAAVAPEPGADGRVYPPIDDLKPGMHQYLNPGEKMTWNNPPQPGIDVADYSRVNHLAIAAGLQIPYESLTGDLRNTSFASGRLGRLDFRERVEVYRWQMLVPRICIPLAHWFTEALAIEEPRAVDAVPLFVPPPREWIDPATEVNAYEKAVRAGFKSREQVVRMMGDDPARVLEEVAADLVAQKKAKVVFTTNPAEDLGREAKTPGRRPGEGSNVGKGASG